MTDKEWEEEALKSCAGRVYDLITEKYRSLAQFSRESGINISTLRNWSYSLQYPDIMILPALVKYLDTPADELLWNGGEWQTVRNRIKKAKGSRPEYVNAIRAWRDMPFSVLLTNAIIYEDGSITNCASHIGVCGETMRKYTSGESVPKTKYLKKICEYFNLSADDALATIALEIAQNEIDRRMNDE